MSHQELACGKSLLELSVYEGTALWWFNQTEVFEAIRQIVNSEAGPDSGANGMIGVRSRSNAISITQGAAIQVGLAGICSLANCLNGLSRRYVGKKGPALLITHDAEWRPVFDVDSGRTTITDRFFHPLADELRDRGFEVSSVSVAVPPYLRSLETSSERRRARFSRHLLIDGYSSLNGVLSRLEAARHFSKVAETIGNDAALDRMLAEYGERNGERVKEILVFSFLRRFPDFVKRIDQARQMLLRMKPSAVLIENEAGFFQRAVIAAAQSLRVPTIALQHGEISLITPAYNFQPQDICDKRQSPTCVPMPDLTLVYGPHYEELLTHQSAFPPNRVVAVGNMQFDSLARLDMDRAKNDLRKELSIAPELRIVLWTTQTHSWNREEAESASKAIEGALSGLPQAQLIVKQHPMETMGHKEALQRVLQPLGPRVTFAPKEHDILTLISGADVVITKDSTTGLEAVAMKKPLIVLNLSGMEDKVDYAKEGAAVGVYRPEDLQPAIRDALAGRGTLGERRQGYVKRYLLELDGKAAKRVADLIESVSGETTGGRD